MTTKLVDSGWPLEIAEALRADSSELMIISPFIKRGALQRLLSSGPKAVRVITRFNLSDFAESVSDISALRRLLGARAKVRGVKNLHAKMYLFGSSRAIVTSANLTEAALTRNHEFGMVSQDAALISACRRYFDDLWDRGGLELAIQQLDEWDQILTRYRVNGGRPIQRANLGDYGVDAGVVASPPSIVPARFADATQGFVKFLGEGKYRAPLSFPIIEEIDRAGCHWSVGYPKDKRPKGVNDDALIFFGRLTNEPNDIRIFGRAIGMRHVPNRDDATIEEIAHREWRAKWPHYIRVHDAEFVSGTMDNGVSLNALMEALGAGSFEPTRRNAEEGQGKNVDPRKAYRQQPAVELSTEGMSWLGERLQGAFDRHGKISQDEIDKIGWPVVR
ncbi:phospholipase D family protein [Mesorhizobium sp. XAP10]|uniref:phospholipase D family protein n=1 Tax=unclassified Mesorhizobium TaxID=325217 RepID=UPI0023DEBE4C|nr:MULTISPECIES: phospholipase D family protein [unclassified Mesorhizobium]MDF3154061.1 phospholipase D family protein [Mesorhizobium sp. XAP10]MDF3247170.1 phospholipase D family protein [Mesorhizobium sp. XAP4]